MQTQMQPRRPLRPDLSVQEDSPSAQLQPDISEQVGNAELLQQLGLGAEQAQAPVVEEEAPAAATSTLNEEALTTCSDAAVALALADMADYAATAIPGILRQCALREVTNANQAAYVLATAQHESRFGKPLYSRSESLVEDSNPFRQSKDGKWSSTVHTSGRAVSADSKDELETKYWDSAYGGRLGNVRGTTDGRDFRGRGYVQLTGRDNYASASERLNAQNFSYTVDEVTYGGAGNPAIDLTAHPDHVNRVPDLAARVLVDGMQTGSFTGVGMDDYINDQETDFTNARRVVNGDTATNGASIAEIAQGYVGALSSWAQVFVKPSNS